MEHDNDMFNHISTGKLLSFVFNVAISFTKHIFSTTARKLHFKFSQKSSCVILLLANAIKSLKFFWIKSCTKKNMKNNIKLNGNNKKLEMPNA